MALLQYHILARKGRGVCPGEAARDRSDPLLHRWTPWRIKVLPKQDLAPSEQNPNRAEIETVGASVYYHANVLTCAVWYGQHAHENVIPEGQ
jgi:hypothetical protein